MRDQLQRHQMLQQQQKQQQLQLRRTEACSYVRKKFVKRASEQKVDLDVGYWTFGQKQCRGCMWHGQGQGLGFTATIAIAIALAVGMDTGMSADMDMPMDMATVCARNFCAD